MTNKINICQAKLSKSQTEVSTWRQKLPENAFLDSLCEEEKSLFLYSKSDHCTLIDPFKNVFGRFITFAMYHLKVDLVKKDSESVSAI